MLAVDSIDLPFSGGLREQGTQKELAEPESSRVSDSVSAFFSYLLLAAMSPFLHVGGSRTRLGVVVVGRLVYLGFHRSFPPWIG